MSTDTFLSLLQTNNILIPVIQRDYAHGRNDEKSKSVREGFVSSLMDAALGRKEMHLDFIYGKKEGENFIPFDGQQRLTTLFLFYRYVAEKIGDKDTIKKTLAKFRYNTRASAKLFCEALCDNDILHEDKLIPIKNRLWFLPNWEYDPTINGMLVVLEVINDKFKEGNIVDNPSIKNLESFIHFKCLPMHELGLDDDAYITMNARFLSLTPWENFKASFQQWADTKEHKDIYETLCSSNIPYGSFDGKWLDLFYRDDKENYDKNMMDMVHFHLYVMRNPKEQGKLSRTDFVPFSEYQKILDDEKKILVPLFRFWNYLCESKEKKKNHIESVFPIWERHEYAEDIEQEKKEGKESSMKLADIINLKTKYNKRLAYYALMLYFEDKNEESKDPLKGIGDWMRIVQNILEHANLSADDEQKHKNKLRELRKQFFNGDIINDKMKGDIWSKEIEEESLKYKFLQENIGQADDLYRLEAHPWIHGRLETYRYRSPDGNKKIDLDKLKKRREWLDNALKKNLVDKEIAPETIAYFRYKIIKIILNSKRGDLTRTVIEFENPDSSWVSELKKGTWDAVWDYYGKEIPDIDLSDNIENWPKGRLDLLHIILEHKGRGFVLLANYTQTFPHTPYIKQKLGGNVATSYLLDFDHYIPAIQKDPKIIITGQYDNVKYYSTKEKDCYILKAEKKGKKYNCKFKSDDVKQWGAELLKKMQDLPQFPDESDSSSSDSAAIS